MNLMPEDGMWIVLGAAALVRGLWLAVDALWWLGGIAQRRLRQAIAPRTAS